MKDYYSAVSLRSNMSKQPKDGFKLRSTSEKEDERSVAAGSFRHKQRIDSMFDDTRSIISGVSQNKSTYDNRFLRYNQRSSENIDSPYRKPPITNEVQNRINKMFQEVNSTELNGTFEIVKFQKFPVAYMGSINLREKVTSLRELQVPLKELYFDYIRSGRTSCLVHGSLEITNAGLKVKNYGNSTNRPSEKLTPFSSIAVWAAVKFVFRKKDQYAVMPRSELTEFAFMPLIADPESLDKISLYQALTLTETNLLVEGEHSDNPPLFIVVMRESTLVNSFDCHGFICSSSNDAIILAANLYTALVQAMPSSPLNNSNYSEPRDRIPEYPPKHYKNPLSRNNSCGSLARSQARNCDEDLRVALPKKPPRKQKYQSDSGSFVNVSSEELNKTPTPRSIKNKSVRKFAASLDNINNIQSPPSADIYFENNKSMGSLVSSSSKQLQSSKNKHESDGGDILTKVAIPRSKSFLNACGPSFSRYTKGGEVSEYSAESGSRRKTNIVSPLGLNELFQEFKQEGLYSMNDILDAIIDPDGMSFNDLKPIYKEFVLKLALTLTKDELYQRSKSIMQKQKHKKRQLDRRENIKKSFISGNILKRALRRSVTNLKYSKYKQNSMEFTSVLFSSSTSDYLKKRSSSYSDRQLSISEMSSISSRDKLSVRKQRIDPRFSHSKKSSERSRNSKSPDYYSYGIKRDGRGVDKEAGGKKSYLHNCSSGYISCSECSYSSDSCACSSNEKCYCSLGNKRYSKPCEDSTGPLNISPCECDTDSCFQSDKCYCNQSSLESSSDKSVGCDQRKNSVTVNSNRGARASDNLFRGIQQAVAKERSVNGTIKESDETHVDVYKPPWPNKSSQNSSRALAGVKDDLNKRRQSSVSTVNGSFGEPRRSRGGTISSEKKFRDKNGIDDARGEKKVLVVSARDPTGKVVYMGQTRAKSVPQDLQNIITSDDALCVKKTAEIAALFSSSNDNIIYNTLEPPDNFNEKYFKSSYVDTNLESSLGYLP